MNKTLLLNNHQIIQKINRMAFELYEHNYDEQEIILAGITKRGFLLAEKIKEALEKFTPLKITLIPIHVEKDTPYLVENAKIDTGIFENKVVVVIDDVLNSGKTLIYGLNQFLHAPIKKLCTLVLLDRNHKQYPINADFVGLSLATTLQQHIHVEFENNEIVAYLD